MNSIRLTVLKCQSLNFTNVSIRHMKRWVAPTLREINVRRKRAGPQPEQPRSSFLEWNYDAELFAFSRRLGENLPTDELKQIFNLKHDEESSKLYSYTMLQNGEQIISSFVRETYLKSYKPVIVDAIEEYLMSDNVLSESARLIGLRDLIVSNNSPPNKHELSNALKSTVALLHKQSVERANFFVADFILCHMANKDIFTLWKPNNPLEYLKKTLEERGIKEVEPRLCNESAVNTILANYQVGLYSNKKLLGIGWGETVDIAKNTAAIDALRKYAM